MAVKLIIPKKVHNKYTYLLNRFKNLEWSGPAWYKVKTDKDGYPTEFKILHFHPLDLGSHAATEWEAKDFAKIIVDTYKKRPSLEKACCGLIHSHNTMGAFLSGTDTATIQEMAPDKEGFYGSLVVASAGKALHAFGFGYKDQYKCSHYFEVEEDDIKIQIPELKPEEGWIAEADFIEKNKPAVVYKPTSQVGLWGGNGYRPNINKHIPHIDTVTEDRNTITLKDQKQKVLDKMTKKLAKQVAEVLLMNNAGDKTDVETEDRLQALGVSIEDITILMDDGYNYGYGYGGYNGYY